MYFTGKTHRQGTNSTGDDDIVLEVVIQMADCDLSDDASTHVFSVGNKLANFIFIYDHDITVSRDGNEIPDLSLTLTGTIMSRYNVSLLTFFNSYGFSRAC